MEPLLIAFLIWVLLWVLVSIAPIPQGDSPVPIKTILYLGLIVLAIVYLLRGYV